VPDASYPNFAGKHAGEALHTAADFVAYLRRVGARGDERAPAGVIMCYQRSLYDHVLRAEGLDGRTPRGLPVALPRTGGRVGLLGKFGIGAPAAAVELEQLAALGTSAVVSVGTAGSLQRDLAPGDLVLCEAAIRDEGVSHHYLPPARLVRAPVPMTAALGSGMTEAGLTFRTGISWTIDAPYRETVAEARHYQAEGVLCVEMEAAALFAVAQVRGLALASAFVISDSLAEEVWSPRFRDPAVQGGLVRLYQAAVGVLAAGLDGLDGPVGLDGLIDSGE
jgi:uridine phosphorylase